MKRIIRTSAVFTAIALASASGLAKKQLDHDSFDSWQLVRNNAICNSGEWSAFAVNPQEGDGILTFTNTRNGKKIEIERGYNPQFTADSRWAVALVKPHYADTRKAKIDKKKDFDMPQDSLAIIDLRSGKVEKIADVISFRLGKEGGDWIAYQSCDTTLIRPKALNDKKAGRPVVLRSLPTARTKTINWVRDYSFSKDGTKLAVSLKKQEKDSLAVDGIGFVSLPDTSFILVDHDSRHYGTPVINESGTMMAYTASNDSVESGTRKSSLYLCDLTRSQVRPRLLLDSVSIRRPGQNLMPANASDPELQAKLEERRRKSMAGQVSDFYVNQYSTPLFSHDGRRVVIGVAPYIAPDDTSIVDFERATLDIWRWDAPYIPPQEKLALDKLRKQTFPTVIDLASGDLQTLTTEPLTQYFGGDRWDSDWALLRDPSENIVSHQWDYAAPVDISIININNGEMRYVGKVSRDDGDFSPAAKYIIWFSDRNYYTYNVATGKTQCISSGMEFPVWDESDDHPMAKGPYGLAAWTEGDNAVLVYDRHDIWSLDPDAKRAPVCLTAGEGRKKNLRYRYQSTDPDFRFVSNGENMLLRVFDYADKRHGLATMKYTGKPSVPVTRVLRDMTFQQIIKAKDAPVYSWQMSNFSTSPNVYVCRGLDFAKAHRVSDANPQMADYNWGTAELVKWYAYDGTPTEGVLYKPEDFDPEKKYPMLVVFYETNSEELYRHYVMEPSWSWVNYPFYVSRGYIVFVPDIHYTAGVPGECAYNFVCSGVEELCKRHDWIDKEKIGIDGQSWGGYQTAYLVTRTNMFACAGSGAPVANMTSAFGGIRWESGTSRQPQYEQGQSRIGRNLWDSPGLYIANSPLFYADRVRTPLLIMHNDADGAVPWYQGIELFMALRRLEKPVWMLQYNGEAHNLKERRNRKDITIRLQQFFDHYLKGAPMPEWMKYGVPMIRKGQETGTSLVED